MIRTVISKDISAGINLDALKVKREFNHEIIQRI